MTAPQEQPRDSIVSGGTIIKSRPAQPGVDVSEEAWDRLYRHVQRIKQPGRFMENLMWAALAIAFAAGLAFIGWYGLDATTQASVQAQGWVYGGFCVGAIVVGLVAFGANRGKVDQLARERDDILEEMEWIQTPVSRAKAAEPAAPPPEDETAG